MPSLLDVRRTAAALVAVALSAALIAFAFIVSDSYTTGMQADARLSLGGADAVVVPARPSEGGGPLDDAVIARLSDLDGVASVRGEHMDILRLDLPEQLTRAVGSAVLAQDVPALSERTTLTAGRLPQGPGEVAIDTTLAKQQELGVGDVIRLKNTDDDIRTSPTVVGIVSPGPDAGLDSSTGGAVYATVDQLAAMGARTAYHRLYVDAEPGVSTGDLVSEVEQVVHAVQPAASVVDADTAVAQRAAASQSGGTMIATLLNLLAPVCAVVSAIVIATTFTALVARQTRTAGLLRCIGASRRQVMGAVLRTAALTGLIGSILGAGLGAGVAVALIRAGVIEDLGADQLTITPSPWPSPSPWAPWSPSSPSCSRPAAPPASLPWWPSPARPPAPSRPAGPGGGPPSPERFSPWPALPLWCWGRSGTTSTSRPAAPPSSPWGPWRPCPCWWAAPSA